MMGRTIKPWINRPEMAVPIRIPSNWNTLAMSLIWANLTAIRLAIPTGDNLEQRKGN